MCGDGCSCCCLKDAIYNYVHKGLLIKVLFNCYPISLTPSLWMAVRYPAEPMFWFLHFCNVLHVLWFIHLPFFLSRYHGALDPLQEYCKCRNIYQTNTALKARQESNTWGIRLSFLGCPVFSTILKIHIWSNWFKFAPLCREDPRTIWKCCIICSRCPVSFLSL